jgi:hypothetical protein
VQKKIACVRRQTWRISNVSRSRVRETIEIEYCRMMKNQFSLGEEEDSMDRKEFLLASLK